MLELEKKSLKMENEIDQRDQALSMRRHQATPITNTNETQDLFKTDVIGPLNHILFSFRILSFSFANSRIPRKFSFHQLCAYKIPTKTKKIKKQHHPLIAPSLFYPPIPPRLPIFLVSSFKSETSSCRTSQYGVAANITPWSYIPKHISC